MAVVYRCVVILTVDVVFFRVPASSILRIPSPRRFVPGCGRHLQGGRCSSLSNLSVALPTSQLILQPFRRFTYVIAHSPTLPLLHLRHSSISNPSFASPTQALHLIHLASRPRRLLNFFCQGNLYSNFFCGHPEHSVLLQCNLLDGSVEFIPHGSLELYNSYRRNEQQYASWLGRAGVWRQVA